MAYVVFHGCLALMLRIDEIEFNHELTTVADTEAQGVLTLVICLKSSLGLVIPKESTGPSFCRTKHIGVGESATEYNHVDILKCLTSRHEVGHMHILDIEAGQIQRVGHFPIAVDAFLSNNCGTYARFAVTAE